ncbi:MAG TPA: c-type cytochrome [Gemmatimonadales bacterium]|nr:cytochrome c [Hyphomicrobiaceae bacterium]HWC72338.1 c-type cytochrome [Gemmatimonadales bacterium]
MWATNLRIIGIVLGTLALYTLIANKIPQVQSEVPHALTLAANVTPEQLASAGDQLYHGAGGCTACHGLGTRAPNLLTDEKGAGPIGARCGKREPGKDCKAYLYESLTSPKAFVVSGYEPIMPEMGRILSPQQIWALVAFLESNGGTVDVSASDIPPASGPASSGAPATSSGGGGIAGGNTDPMTIIRGAGCTGCHTINGEGGKIGPDLTHVGSRLSKDLIRESILLPDAKVAKGYEKFKGVMPKTFGNQLTGAQLESLVQFLSSHK